VDSDITKKQLFLEHKGKKLYLDENHTVKGLIDSVYSIQSNIDYNINYHDSRIRFYEEKLVSIESLGESTFAQSDELIQARVRLNEIERDMAQMEENNPQHDIDVMEVWDSMIDHLPLVSVELDQPASNLIDELNTDTINTDMEKQPELLM